MTVQIELRRDIFYGKYDPKRWEKNEATLRRRLGLKAAGKGAETLPKADQMAGGNFEPVPSGIMAEIQPILKQIESLAIEADKYDDDHIKQDFRRINARLLEMQVKLDRINVANDADAKAAVKRGIVESEEAANRLMDNISHDYKKCSECLRL